MASPVCSPSRGAMLTGCYPPRISFGSFHDDWVLFPGDPIGLNPKEITIADILKSQDYSTMIIGKWHCGDQPEFLPTRHGFDDYYGIPYSNDMAPMETRPKMPPLPLMRGEEVIEQQPDQKGITERYVEKSVEFIRKNKEKPFFLYLAHMHVHLPLYAADSFVKSSRNGDYGACVAAIDWATKAIVHELTEQGLLENTMIIFTSDNGSRNDFGESNGPLRGSKATTWEGGQRVPFIVYWKGTIEPGVNSGLVCSLDIFPSIAAMVGANQPNDRVIDGINQLDLILGRSETSNRDNFFYYMCNNLEAVRHKNWKLFVSRRPGAGKPSSEHDGTSNSVVAVNQNEAVFELYNLEEDIGEEYNVYEQNPEIVEKLYKMIEECRNDLGDSFTNTKGENIRPIGKVEHAKPLTTYDINHPYIVALYDRNEVG